MTATRYDGAAFQALARTRYDGSAWQPLKSYRYDGAVFQEFAGPEAAEPTASGWVGSTQTTAANSITVTMPTTVTAGDTLLMAVGSRSTGAVFTATGWAVQKTITSTLSGAILTKTADGTEGGTTVAVAYTGTANRASAAAVRLQGTRGIGTPSGINAGGVASIAAPSVTTTGINRLLLGVFFQTASTSDTWTAPAGMTSHLTVSNSGAAIGLLVATEDRPTAGSTGTRTATISPTSGGMQGYLVPVQPNWA